MALRLRLVRYALVLKHPCQCGDLQSFDLRLSEHPDFLTINAPVSFVDCFLGANGWNPSEIWRCTEFAIKRKRSKNTFTLSLYATLSRPRDLWVVMNVPILGQIDSAGLGPQFYKTLRSPFFDFIFEGCCKIKNQLQKHSSTKLTFFSYIFLANFPSPLNTQKSVAKTAWPSEQKVSCFLFFLFFFFFFALLNPL